MFKLFFKNLCISYLLLRKLTTVEHPQANAVLERIHQVGANMMKCTEIDMQGTCTPEIIGGFVINVGWVVCFAHHIVYKALPGAAIFVRDMLFKVP